MDQDDDIPQLPADTLELLNNFISEKDAKLKQFEELKSKAEDDFQSSNGKLTMDLFSEDWNASQFWYTDETARTLAKQLLHGAGSDSVIAVVSAPSVYVALRNILAENEDAAKPKIYLLEYDRRFEVVGSDFVFYDFQQPLRLPAEMKGGCDRIICDPPFLSEDCQTKTALTVRYLMHTSALDVRFISCTGERMGPLMSKLHGKNGTRITTFEPEHSKGLSNEFRCYANFECSAWKWQ